MTEETKEEFYIAFRLTKKQHLDQWDSPRAQIEDLSFNLREKFQVDRLLNKKHFVPHVTFVPSFYTNDIENVINDLWSALRVRSFTENLQFELAGIAQLEYDDKEALVVVANSNHIMDYMRRKMLTVVMDGSDSHSLGNLSKSYLDWSPHIKLVDDYYKGSLKNIANVARSYSSEKNLFPRIEIVSRITIMKKENKNNFIYKEFDFMRKEWLDRHRSLRNDLWKENAEYLKPFYEKLND